MQSTPTPNVPSVQVSLAPRDVSVKPLPIQAGYPFTITLVIHNDGGASPEPAGDGLHLSRAGNDRLLSLHGVLTVTLPSTRPVTLEVPVRWNLTGGENRLWAQVNRLPKAWQPESPTWPEEDKSDNSVLLELIVEPFDAYRSDLCSGRVDVEIDAGVVAERAASAFGCPSTTPGTRPPTTSRWSFPAKTWRASPTHRPSPVRGTAEVWVQVDRPLAEGESIAVNVTPKAGKPAGRGRFHEQRGERAGRPPCVRVHLTGAGRL